jgi:predicted nucleic acid-binding protein
VDSHSDLYPPHHARRNFQTPLPPETAFDIVGSWLSQPSVIVMEPGVQHFRNPKKSAIAAWNGRKSDLRCHLAALAIEHGAELLSLDSDFARFPRLRWRNPLD